jgi:hypothetical protein
MNFDSIKNSLKTFINDHGIRIQTRNLVVSGLNPLFGTIFLRINHINYFESEKAYQLLFILQSQCGQPESETHCSQVHY